MPDPPRAADGRLFPAMDVPTGHHRIGAGAAKALLPRETIHAAAARADIAMAQPLIGLFDAPLQLAPRV